MATFVFPTSQTITEIAQDKLPNLVQNRVGFQLMPMVDVDSYLVMWDQKDNFVGLQQHRGLNGEPPKVQRTGAKRYQVTPGIYGEFALIDERELTIRRQYGTFGTPIDISDLVMDAQDQLLGRRLDRIELVIWTLLTTGAFTVLAPDGSIAQQDAFSLQTFTSTVPWATSATSTPLLDLRNIKLKSRGHSVNFGTQATLWINQVTANNLLQNANANDLFGRRLTGLTTINNVGDINRLLAGDDLPTIQIYDEGYLNDAGTFVPFIANNKGVLVGRRPAGQVIGDYALTRNANNPTLAPGAYMRVFDRGEDQVPRQIEVHDGHNGGPRVYYPSAIVVCNF